MNKSTGNRAARAGFRLLRTPAPLPDESLMGYIIRLTAVNWYESPRWILDLARLKLAPLDAGWRRLCRNRVDFTLLRQITGLSQGDINKMRHRIAEYENSDYEPDSVDEDVPAEAVILNRSKICPDCLRETPYCRKLWDLSVVTSCPNHHVLLLDKCPGCGHFISWDRNEVSRCPCGCDWTRAKTFRLPESELRAMKLLSFALKFGGSVETPVHDDGDFLKRLSFGDLCRVLLALSGFFPRRKYEGGPGTKPEIYLYHRILERTISVFDDWPKGFYRFCEDVLARIDYVDLAESLNELADRDSLAFLLVALEEHLEQSHDYDDPLLDVLAHRRFLSAAEAGRRLLLSEDASTRLLTSKQLRTVCSVSRPQEVLLDEKSICKLLEYREHLVSVEFAGDKIGLTKEEIHDLIHYDCLQAASGPEIDGFPDLRVEINAVVEFYKRVRQMAVPIDNIGAMAQADGDLIGFQEAKEQMEENGLGLGQWFKTVLAGEIRTLICEEPAEDDILNPLLLTKLAFSRRQFEQYIKQYSLKDTPEFLERKRRKAKQSLSVSAMTALLKRLLNTRSTFPGLCSETLNIELLGVEAKDLGRLIQEVYERSLDRRGKDYPKRKLTQ